MGALVAKAQREGVPLRAAAAAELSPAVLGALDLETAVRAKAARGGTAPDAVRASLAAARAAAIAG
jgi:argininosuccinate lyase